MAARDISVVLRGGFDLRNRLWCAICCLKPSGCHAYILGRRLNEVISFSGLNGQQQILHINLPRSVETLFIRLQIMCEYYQQCKAIAIQRSRDETMQS